MQSVRLGRTIPPSGGLTAELRDPYEPRCPKCRRAPPVVIFPQMLKNTFRGPITDMQRGGGHPAEIVGSKRLRRSQLPALAVGSRHPSCSRFTAHGGCENVISSRLRDRVRRDDCRRRSEYASADQPVRAATLEEAQRLFYSGHYDAAAALALVVRSAAPENLAASELRGSALHFQIRRVLGASENKTQAWAQCDPCEGLYRPSWPR